MIAALACSTGPRAADEIHPPAAVEEREWAGVAPQATQREREWLCRAPTDPRSDQPSVGFEPSTMRTEERAEADKPPELPLRIVQRERRAAGVDNGACVIDDGSLYCWGWILTVPWTEDLLLRLRPPVRYYVRPNRVALPGPATAVVMARFTGPQFGAVLLQDGSVYTWGQNGTGSLGLGAGSCRTVGHAFVPQRVPLEAPALEIAALDEYACARLVGGRVACWGGTWNFRAPECGVPTFVTTPDGAPLTGMVRMEVGVALDRRGVVHAWGHDEHGQVSRRADPSERFPNRLVAHVIEGLPPIVDVGSSVTGICALTEQGEVLCWGDVSMSVRHAERAWPLSREELARAVTEPTLFGSPAPARALYCTVAGCMVLAGDQAYWRGAAWVGEGSPWPIAPDVISVAVSPSGGCFERRDGFHCWGRFHPYLERQYEPASVAIYD